MSFKPIRPYVVLSTFFVGAIAAVHFTGTPSVVGEPAIRLELPASVGAWTGTDVFFCQKEECMHSFTADDLDDETTCPRCGGDIDTVSLPEKLGLPEDTVIVRKQYALPSGEQIFVTVVLTGARRSSIHRPQWCLPGQGHTIESSRVIEVPFEKRGPLSVMLLDLTRPVRSASGREQNRTSSYAYWFVGKEHETPYHLQRLIWMAADNIFLGASYRWAFISVAASRMEGSDRHVKKMSSFIAEFYPLIAKN